MISVVVAVLVVIGVILWLGVGVSVALRLNTGPDIAKVWMPNAQEACRVATKRRRRAWLRLRLAARLLVVLILLMPLLVPLLMYSLIQWLGERITKWFYKMPLEVSSGKATPQDREEDPKGYERTPFVVSRSNHRGNTH